MKHECYNVRGKVVSGTESVFFRVLDSHGIRSDKVFVEPL